MELLALVADQCRSPSRSAPRRWWLAVTGDHFEGGSGTSQPGCPVSLVLMRVGGDFASVKIRRLPAQKSGSPRLHLHRRTLGPWSGAKGRRV